MSQSPPSRRQAFAEIILIFAIFFIQGAWPVPDVNETCALAKAFHFWQPDWLRGDFFMESANTYRTFYVAFGWLALWLSPASAAWVVRMAIWAGLAWSWRRLSWAIVPRRWWAILTAALLACLIERCHMAGEWLLGGAEAKPFAYIFVFLGIEALVRNRWNRALWWFGVSSAFHVLVGGWSAVAAGAAWTWLRWLNRRQPDRLPPRLLSLWPGVLGGLMLAAPGIIPALTLDWGVNGDMLQEAHRIYVFERLPHHLTLTGMKPAFIVRLTLLFMFWIFLGRLERRRFRQIEKNAEPAQTLERLRAFVAGAVTIALVGVVLNTTMFIDRLLAADLLRYYWFRLTDIIIPLGVVLEVAALVADALEQNSRNRTASAKGVLFFRRFFSPRFFLVAIFLIAAVHFHYRLQDHLSANASVPRSHRIPSYTDWMAACRWVAANSDGVNGENAIPPDARFFVPRHAQAFKWHTGRGDVTNWKDIPQSAYEILRWWEMMQDIYATNAKNQPDAPRWFEQPADMGVERLRKLKRQYGAKYVITQRTAPLPGFVVLYQNDTYAVLRIE